MQVSSLNNISFSTQSSKILHEIYCMLEVLDRTYFLLNLKRDWSTIVLPLAESRELIIIINNEGETLPKM
jgi:hypothetical protein